VTAGETSIEQWSRLEKQYGYTEVDQLLAGADADADDAYDWVVPGLLEYGDRLILTGAEGSGKSTLLHQMAMQIASGLHPFGGADIGDRCVLLVDCENGRRSLRRRFGVLRETAGARYNEDRSGLYIANRPQGIDLLDATDVTWLYKLHDKVQPDLLIIGPLYRLAMGDPIKEEVARAVANVIDHLRHEPQCAVIIEAHSPHASDSRTKRPTRPYGASYWVRWCEFGVFLAADGRLEHWRGPRDERAWPAKLTRSKPWPWMIDDSVPDAGEEWHGPTACMAAVVEALTEVAASGNTGRSGRQVLELVKLRGNGFRQHTVTAACEQLAIDHRLSVQTGPRGGRYYSLNGVNEPHLGEAF
jgi:hypothetical protein